MKIVAWNISGELVETCSCNMLCPCWYGKKELMKMDRGWCATSLLLRVNEGNYEGTDLSGRNAVLGLFMPGPTLYDGDGTARVYVDDGANDAQMAALENVLQGRTGGPMQIVAALTNTWLPTQKVPLAVSEENGKLQVAAGNHGKIVSERLVNELGDTMAMQNAAFILAFEFEGRTADLAPSDGTTWRDPEMPEALWDCKSGAVGKIAWQVA